MMDNFQSAVYYKPKANKGHFHVKKKVQNPLFYGRLADQLQKIRVSYNDNWVAKNYGFFYYKHTGIYR